MPKFRLVVDPEFDHADGIVEIPQAEWDAMSEREQERLQLAIKSFSADCISMMGGNHEWAKEVERKQQEAILAAEKAAAVQDVVDRVDARRHLLTLLPGDHEPITLAEYLALRGLLWDDATDAATEAAS